ncbi:MAG: CYTH domain-containing protein [Deltaproteobacteria bacterium]|nr:CYTH domain-containing protein [Deltaproteobacteria bacterium]
MSTEIEKKFLVTSEKWRGLAPGKHYSQGYLSREKETTVRVRIINDQGFITVKGAVKGETRPEFEYEIPLQDARELLSKLCHKPLIEKTRYKIPFGEFIWEVDEFAGENKGLIFAEIELNYEGQEFSKPDWIGEEVTGDPRYYNASLVTNPYRDWREETTG